jgi:hypothetical protein
MPGGELNLTATGSANVILTGNPTKTFFKVVYSKYTNFGLQKFRLDYEGMRDLRLTTSSTFKFKVKRHADLLMDTYLCITLPDIWSPIYPPCNETSYKWAGYDFRWIRDLGTNLIENISITCGSMLLQSYSGAYLEAMILRDFPENKKRAFDEMSGNTKALYDPVGVHGRSGTYPSAYYVGDGANIEPSIRGRNLYIPINAWFMMDSRCAFPLVALQYNELYINVTIRPIQELFQVRDVYDWGNKFPYVQPDFTKSQFGMYRFLQQPPGVNINQNQYENQTTTWNADVHLLATYCFLSGEERKKIALEDQAYLVKDVFEYNFENVVGSKTVSLTSNGMVANWMWRLQRNDVNLRNEWSNYSNWPYREPPSDIFQAPITTGTINGQRVVVPGEDGQLYTFGPGLHPPDAIHLAGTNTGYYITGMLNQDNLYDIMVSMGISLNGVYRENVLPSEVFNYVEQYSKSNGSGKRGLYCYSFGLNTSPFEYQPSGAMNLSRFKDIDLEITTIVPVVSEQNKNYEVICDAVGNTIGINKQNWRLYDYTFNMTLYEERYNVLSIIGGNAGMLYAR